MNGWSVLCAQFRLHVLFRWILSILCLGLLSLVTGGSILSAIDTPPAPPPPIKEARPLSAPNTITYTYDAAGRLDMVIYSGKLIAYTYDANGNLIAVTDKLDVYLPVTLKEFD